MKNIIGIDVGGTKIVGGRIENGAISHLEEADTLASTGGEITIGVLKGVIESLITPATAAIGIGVPSVVDRDKGIVYNVQNIKGWDEVHLKEIIEKEYGLPVYIDNDANCYAIGERIFGKGRNYRHFVGITLGTGVGGGIVQDGHLLKDANCGSGEFGELPYLDTIVEEYCGSRFFVREGGMSGYEAAMKARDKDEAAIELYDQYGHHMSELIKMIMLTIDPEAIILGGSIAQAFDLFEGAMHKGLEDFSYPKSVDKLQIVTSELQNTGVLGAGALCVDYENLEI